MRTLLIAAAAGEWMCVYFRGSSGWDKQTKKTVYDDVYIDVVSITG